MIRGYVAFMNCDSFKLFIQARNDTKVFIKGGPK